MKSVYKPWVVLSLALALAAGARAQQQQQSQTQSQQPQQSQEQPAQPIPAYHSPLAGLSNGSDEATSSSDLQPDQRPLSGVQDLALGISRPEHSFWEPNAVVYSTVDSDPLSSSTETGWVTYTTLLAGIDIHKMSQNSDLTVSYLGGGMISNDPGVGNSVTQELQLGETLNLNRSTLSFFEQTSYAPEMSFGGGAAGLTLPGGNLGLQTGFLPDESILTTRGQRISSTSIGQWNYNLTPRSSLTFVGGYSLLHFFGTDLLNFGDVIFQGGYNYQLTRADTIAVLYNFNADRFTGNQSIDDNKVNISYGRRVTGRLAFQIAAGPEVASLRLNNTGTGGGTTTTTAVTRAYWSMTSGLSYQMRRAQLAASYYHGVNGGSGVLAGAVGDSVSGTASTVFSRTMNGGVNGGFARNGSVTASGPSNQVFDYWFGGANLNRSWGRALNLGLSYQFQHQTSNGSFCIGPTCGNYLTRHMIIVSLSWRDRPLLF